MRYQDKTFTLPVSSGISQEEWNKIWAPELEATKVWEYYDPKMLEVLKRNTCLDAVIAGNERRRQQLKDACSPRSRGSRKRTGNSTA